MMVHYTFNNSSSSFQAFLDCPYSVSEPCHLLVLLCVLMVNACVAYNIVLFLFYSYFSKLSILHKEKRSY